MEGDGREQLESNHHKNQATGKEGEANQMSRAHPSKKKKLWYACRLYGTNILKEGAMWHVDPLLGNDCETNI
jgi:hypothetical protein